MREQALGMKITQCLIRCKFSLLRLKLQTPMKIGGFVGEDYPYSLKGGLGVPNLAN